MRAFVISGSYRSQWHHEARFGLMTQWSASAYIRIKNDRLEGSTDGALGCMVLTKEVIIKTNNVANGAMVTGWNLIGGKWYYMHSTGSMAFNQWIETNGKWYYVTSDGSIAVNTTIGTYKVDENGVWVD